MVRNILPLVILAFVFFLQGLAPKVRTFRERQLQQVPPTHARRAGRPVIQMGLPHPQGRTPGGHCTGQSLAVCNSTGSVDGSFCRSTKAKWLRCKKDPKMHVVPVPALPAEDKAAI